MEGWPPRRRRAVRQGWDQGGPQRRLHGPLHRQEYQAAGLAEKCTVALAYAIGRADPVAVDVDTHLTGTYSDKLLEQAVRCFFDLTPAGMIHTLQLNQPIFADACNYGHFTRANLPWEQTGQAGKFAELCAQLDHGDGGG